MSTATPTPAAARLLRLADPATRPAATPPAEATAGSAHPPLDTAQPLAGTAHPPLDTTASAPVEPEGSAARPVRFALGRRAGIALLAAVLVLAGIALAQLLRSEPVAVSAPQLPALDDGHLAAATPGPDAAAHLASGAPADPAAAGPTPAAPPGGSPVVSVVGLVHHPGLVTLPAAARVADALAAAGGAMPGADTGALNLARPVADGEQIIVGAVPSPENPDPLRSQVIAPGQSVLGVSPVPGAPGGPGAAPAPGGAGAPPAAGGGAGPGDAVNLNTADETTLEKLPGVGPATAAAIVAHRDTHGPFTSVEQLLEVDGIGPGKLDKIRDKATV